MAKILGKQNTPCGHYNDERDIECDAITCRKIETPTGTWHLHKYFVKHPGRAKHCKSDQHIFIKIKWSARFVHAR